MENLNYFIHSFISFMLKNPSGVFILGEVIWSGEVEKVSLFLIGESDINSNITSGVHLSESENETGEFKR